MPTSTAPLARAVSASRAMPTPTTISATRPAVRPEFGVSEAVIAGCPVTSGRCEGRRARPREAEAGRKCRLRLCPGAERLDEQLEELRPAGLRERAGVEVHHQHRLPAAVAAREGVRDVAG